MSEPSPYPEFPLPLPPLRVPPQPTQAPAWSPDQLGGGIIRDSLADQRRILVSGMLDREAITGLTAQLMAFDGTSSRDVEMLVSGPGGPVADILPVFDVFGLMRAKVSATAIGAVSGTAVGLVAACTGQRLAAPHARFSLRVDGIESVRGTADDIARHAEEMARQRSRYLTLLSAATGRDANELSDEIDRGGPRTADDARAIGIIDAVVDRG